jgi:hypothetical protein
MQKRYQRINMKDHSTNVLWASAFVLFGLILFVANKHTPTVHADGAISNNGFTMVTSPDGRGTDLLYVVDDQNLVLMVYDVQNPQGESFLNPVVAWSLPAMFAEARK